MISSCLTLDLPYIIIAREEQLPMSLLASLIFPPVESSLFQGPGNCKYKETQFELYESFYILE